MGDLSDPRERFRALVDRIESPNPETEAMLERMRRVAEVDPAFFSDVYNLGFAAADRRHRELAPTPGAESAAGEGDIMGDDSADALAAELLELIRNPNGDDWYVRYGVAHRLRAWRASTPAEPVVGKGASGAVRQDREWLDALDRIAGFALCYDPVAPDLGGRRPTVEEWVRGMRDRIAALERERNLLRWELGREPDPRLPADLRPADLGALREGQRSSPFGEAPPTSADA